jgi:hypothetical protein
MRHAPAPQIMTIDDEAPAAALAHPPRAASFLQRLLSACYCGARQGKCFLVLHVFYWLGR